MFRLCEVQTYIIALGLVNSASSRRRPIPLVPYTVYDRNTGSTMFHLAAKNALKPDVAFRGAQRSISVQVAHMHSQGYHTQDMRQTLLHGSPDARKAGEIEIQQHSRLVARGKYVHGFEGRDSLCA